VTPRGTRNWARKVALEVELLRAEPDRHDSIRRRARRVWQGNDEREAIELGLIDLGEADA
jgi:hypothetical protein